ncbi:MAG: VWA domain-containing protein [Cyanobacteria bacterium SZAS LIN-3]|nr:VWA domain-containing protein [Cyanobacteria bacterium SZAS LIN-3]
MSGARHKKTALFCISSLAASWLSASGPGSCKPAPTQSTAVGNASSVRLYGQVNVMFSACANAGVQIASTTLPARIEKVRMGSPAFYAGLQDNDVIIKGTLNNNNLALVIRRGAAIYGVNLATEAGSGETTAAATNRAAGPGKTTLSTGTTASQTSDPAWKKLQTYDIVMLIDQSGSMSDPVNTAGLTKWDWCSNQLTSFASQALKNTGRRFTIVTFNGNYELRRNCAAEEVQQTFTRNRPGGATDLATPLDFVLNDYMSGARTNPLLVVVLTDGEPAAPELVQQCIIDTTRRMSSPEQIKIVFFEIGDDADGRALIRMLDAGLLGQGARYDIVEANSFERLQQLGLKSALYDTFNHNFQTSLRVSPTNSLQAELELVRRQLEDARARNAQNPGNR